MLWINWAVCHSAVSLRDRKWTMSCRYIPRGQLALLITIRQLIKLEGLGGVEEGGADTVCNHSIFIFSFNI